MVSRIRWNCQEIISDEKMKDDKGMDLNPNGPFKIGYDQANKFIKNINILEFIRKSILSMDSENLKLFFKEIEEKSPSLSADHPASIEGKHDQQLLQHVNKHGLVAYNAAKAN